MEANVGRRLATALGAVVLGLATATASGLAHAQAFPTKPIRLIIPYAPGGGTDITGRLIGNEMEKVLGQPIVLEFKPGATGAVGTSYVATLPPDGHTFLFSAAPAITIAPIVEKSLSYEPFRDLTPLTLLYTVTLVLATRSDAPTNNLRDFVAAAKNAPGKLTYGHSGNFGPPHLTMEMLKGLAGIDILSVPYKSEAPGTLAMLAGEVNSMSMAYAGLSPHIRSGRAKAIAQFGATRIPQMPDVPTAVESGFPSMVVTSWQGAFGPGKLPAPVVEKLYGALAASLKAPAVLDNMNTTAQIPGGQRPEEFTAFLRAESQRWRKVIDERGLLNLPR